MKSSNDLFRRGALGRTLHVWVDLTSLDSGPRLDHLLGFARHEAIDMTAFGGRVDGASEVILEDVGGADSVCGRVIDVDGFSLIGGSPRSTVEHIADRLASEQREEATQVRQSLSIASISEDVADVLVTGSRSVLAAKWGRPASIEEALGFVGTYLRAGDDFTLAIADRQTISYGRGLFYWTVALQVLSSWGPAWRSMAPASRTPHLNGLAHAPITRIEQALRARDRLRLELALPQNNTTADEILWAFDSLIVALDAGFDVVARTLHHHFGLPRGPESARWRSDQWVRHLGRCAPTLASAIVEGGSVANVTAALGDLRRSLHGVPHQTIASQRGGRPLQNLLAIPPDAQVSVMGVVGAEQDRWGLDLDDDGIQYVRPLDFGEALFRTAAAALNDVIGVSVGTLSSQVDAPFDWPGVTKAMLRQILDLAGFSDISPSESVGG